MVDENRQILQSVYGDYTKKKTYYAKDVKTNVPCYLRNLSNVSYLTGTIPAVNKYESEIPTTTITISPHLSLPTNTYCGIYYEIRSSSSLAQSIAYIGTVSQQPSQGSVVQKYTVDVIICCVVLFNENTNLFHVNNQWLFKFQV